MELEKIVIGKCPLCGANVVKTLKGYACENSLQAEPTCNFFLFSTVGNRRFSDNEACEFLENKRILLDGFVTKEGKNFTSVLIFNEDGTVNMTSQIGACPKCRGTLYINSKSVSCGNFKNQTQPCNFTLWRNFGGHELTLNEIDEIVNLGSTAHPVKLYDMKGNCTQQKVGLNSEKEVVKL